MLLAGCLYSIEYLLEADMDRMQKYQRYRFQSQKKVTELLEVFWSFC